MNQISAQAQFVRCDSEDSPDRSRVGLVPLHHPADGPPPPQGEDWRSREPVLTPSRKLRFLDELSRHGNVRVAAGRVGVSRSAVYLAQRRDAAFAAGWRAALVLARDHAEAVLAERALEGVEEQVFYRGELVGARRRYDGRLLLAHLARLDRLCAEDARAVDDAARFDAVIGEVGDLPEAAERHPETGAALTWPPRAEFVAEARADASAEARSLVTHGEGADRWTEEVFDRAKVAAAVAEAGAEWDGFHHCLYGAIDRVLDGESGGAGFGVQDCVHSVQSIGGEGAAEPSSSPSAHARDPSNEPRDPSRHPRAPSRHPRAGGDPSAVAASRIAGLDSRLRGNDDELEGEGEWRGASGPSPAAGFTACE